MSITAVTVPYLASVILLGAAGASKVARPGGTARALQSAGIPASRSRVRIGAAGEVVVAAAALLLPGPITGALVAAAYAGFTGFVVLALVRRWPLSSCGCFTKPDTPPTRSHAALNAGAALCAVWWSASAPSNLVHALARQDWHGSALVLETAVVALLAFVVWTNPLTAVSGRS